MKILRQRNARCYMFIRRRTVLQVTESRSANISRIRQGLHAQGHITLMCVSRDARVGPSFRTIWHNTNYLVAATFGTADAALS